MTLAGIALAFDAAKRRVPFSLLSTGLFDEVAHLATAALGWERAPSPGAAW